MKRYWDASPRLFSFLHGCWTDFEKWKSLARGKVANLLNFCPPKPPLKPRVTKVTDKGSYIREEIIFNTAGNVPVHGSFLIPGGRGGPYPAVIAMHDHGGFYYFGSEKILALDDEPDILKEFKNDYSGGRSWADELVLRGFAVLCIDAFYFGSRKIDISMASREIREMSPFDPGRYKPGTREHIEEFNRFAGWYENFMQKGILCAGATWPGILVYDDQRSVDYLITRKEVDRDRIGCCGLSLGGYRSELLAALDPRIRCAVAAGWMTTHSSLLDNMRHHTFMVYIPGMGRFFDLPDLVAMAAPNSLFIQQCRRDQLYAGEGMSKSCEIIKKVYEKIGCPENFKCSFYDNEHMFTAEMQEDAFKWLEKHLK